VSVVVWIALGVLVVAVVGGAGLVFVRARAFMRAFRTFSADTSEELRRLTRRLDQLARESRSLDPHRGRLDASVERLRVSVARLDILRAAVDDVNDTISRFRVFYQR
jgi:hypothetical protein